MFNIKYVRGVISNFEQHTPTTLYIPKNKMLIFKYLYI